MADKLGIKILFDYKKSYDELNKVLDKLEKRKIDIKVDFGNGGINQNINSINKLANVSEKTLTTQKQKVKEVSDELINLKNKINGVTTAFNPAKNSLIDGSKIVGYSLKEIDKNTQSFTQSINNGKDQIVTYSGTINKLTNDVDLTGKAIKQTTRENNTFTKELGIAIKRTVEWSIAVGGFYKTLRTLKDGTQFVYDLSNQLNEIRIVTGKSADEAERLGLEYNKMAKAMGVGTKDITSASVEFYRQGLESQEEIMTRTQIATQYAKVANEDFKESAEILTAVVNSMGVDIERASDVMLYLGDATATSGGEIGRAMQKVAGSAGALKIPFEKVSSYIAVISSKTRESAESIGTSMKSLLARFSNIVESGFNEEDSTRINDVAKALNSVGLSFTDSEGQMRRFDTLIEELGTKWNNLDENTKAYLATTLAGARQQSRFYNLMDGLDEATTLYNNALESAGTTQNKFGVYLESNEAKLNSFKTTLEGIFLKTISSKGIGKTIEFGESILKLVDNIGLFNIAIIATTALLIKLAIGTKTVEFFGMLTLALTNTALATATLQMALGGIVAVLGLVTLGIYNYNKSQKEMIQKSIEHANSLKQETAQGKQLLDNIQELTNKKSLSADETERLKSLEQQLQELYPNLNVQLELQKGGYEGLTTAVQNLTSAKKADLIAELQASKIINKQKKDDLQKRLDEARKYEQSLVGKNSVTIGNNPNGILGTTEIQSKSLAAQKYLGALKNRQNVESELQTYLDQEKLLNELMKEGTSIKTDTPKISASTEDSLSGTKTSTISANLSEILKKQQKYKNAIADAENLSKNLLNDEYDQRLKNLDVEEKTQKALLDYYESQRGVAKSKNLEDELNKEILSVQSDLASIEKERKEINKDIAEIAKKKAEDDKKTFEDQKKSLEDITKDTIEYEKKIAEIELKNAIQSHENKITFYETENDELQNKIDLLERESDLEDEITETQKRQLEIQKAKDKLNNILQQKDTYMFTGKGANGWEWVSNPQKLAEAQQEVSDLETDFAEYQRDLQRKHQKQSLQDQIDFNKQKIDQEKKSIDILKVTFDLAWNDVDLILDNRLKRLNITQDSNLTAMITTAQSKLSQLQSIYAQLASNPTPSLSSMNFTDGLSQAEKDYLIESGKVNSSMGKDWTEIEQKIKSGVLKFDSGGATGDGEGLAWLDKKEIVLNKFDTSNILETVKYARDMMLQGFKLPKFNLSSAMAGALNDNSIHVDNVTVVANDAQQFIQNLKRQVRR